jgi:hypothetical protein
MNGFRFDWKQRQGRTAVAFPLSGLLSFVRGLTVDFCMMVGGIEPREMSEKKIFTYFLLCKSMNKKYSSYKLGVKIGRLDLEKLKNRFLWVFTI